MRSQKEPAPIWSLGACDAHARAWHVPIGSSDPAHPAQNVHHLELEEDRILAAKLETEIYHASSSSHGVSSSKRKRLDWFNKRKGKGVSASGKKPNANQHERGKCPRMKKLTRVKCYNCDKKSHYARNCRKPKKIQERQIMYRRIENPS